MDISYINFKLANLAQPVIILIGPPGAGKTVVGNLLATNLGWQFWDTDVIIEQSTNLKITEIFDQYGEKSFRLLEQKLAQDIRNLPPSCLHKGTVIACGGGLPIPTENFDNLAKIGKIISLTATIDILTNRTAQAKHRPLLNSPTDFNNKKSQLECLVNERKHIYAKAHLSIDTSNLTVEAVIEQLKFALELNQQNS